MSFRRYLVMGASAALLAGSSITVSWAAGFNIPTDAPASPTFGAQPWSQDMLLFEEFGNQLVPQVACDGCTPMPAVQSCQLAPVSQSIDDFLKQPLAVLPTEYANRTMSNPWLDKIRQCVDPGLKGSPADGRPDGTWFAHQRWSEFKPKWYFQSAQTGARANTGARDQLQMHGWKTGEFAPGGLYYRGGTNKNIDVRFHPNFPVQTPNSVWTFDGTMPPKLLMARYGNPILFRHYNMLPIDVAANNGFGMHTISTHEHNGHNPAESDGFTGAYFFPGQYYDYRWPMILAGHDSINTDKSDPHAGYPDDNGNIVRISGNYRETMSTHWFHDHMFDYTAQNVYKGNAAMMNYYSAIDSGREGYQCQYENPTNINLCFPSGTGLKWGNRDYDVNLVIADKAWDAKGQLFFNVFNTDGFLGDQVLVNFSWKPKFEVRPRRYRFRILNGAVSRYFKLAVADASGKRYPFHMIANDGNIMQHAVPFPNAESADLPAQGIAERYDIIVDFKGLKDKTELFLVNILEHKDGKGPSQIIPLADVMSGKYAGDPAVGKIMKFVVNTTGYTASDLSMNPADYVEGKKKMIEMPVITAAELSTAHKRTFEFGRSGGTDSEPWTIKTDGGQGLAADFQRVSADPTKGTLEVWTLKNGGNGWSHPVHIHFEEGRILSRDGKAPPVWEKFARKDVYRIGPTSTQNSSSVEFALRVREFAGTYVEHCHNTQHEDNAMLLRWDSVNPGQTVMIPTPRPTWEGTYYEDSFKLVK